MYSRDTRLEGTPLSMIQSLKAFTLNGEAVVISTEGPVEKADPTWRPHGLHNIPMSVGKEA